MNMTAAIASPSPTISRSPVKKPRRTLSGRSPPTFWLMNTASAAAPLSPKELAKPSMRVAAV